MKLNELRKHYYYPRIDSWLVIALYANKLNQGESRISITKRYDIANLNKYSSTGKSITSNDRCNNPDIIRCAKDTHRMLAEAIALNDDIKFIEIAVRFLFDKEVCKRFVGRRLLEAYKYGYNVIHAQKPLFYPLLIADIFIELDDDQAIKYLRSFLHWREEKFVVSSILAAKHNQELLIEDAKAFCKTFIDIYNNGISVEDFDRIRRDIDEANEIARKFKHFTSREEKLKRKEKARIAAEKARIAAEKARKTAEKRAKERKEFYKRQVEIEKLREDLNTNSSTIILNTAVPKFNDNDCINAIIVGSWIYWLSNVCHISDDAIGYATGLASYEIQSSNTLTAMRLDVIQKRNSKPMIPIAVGKNKYIDLNWSMAMVADYHIVEMAHRFGISVEQFIHGDTKATREVSIKAMIPHYMVSAAQAALRDYGTDEFAEYLADKILTIVSKEPISAKYYSFQEVEKLWKDLKNTTADASST